MAKEEKRLSARSVTVLQLISEGHTYDQILALQPDMTYLDIFDAAQEALEVVEAMPGIHQEKMAQIRRACPRAYEPWTDEEDAALARDVRSGLGHDEIAAKMQRQPSAIRSRMKKRNLV